MFPHIDLGISGLHMDKSYSVGLVIEQADRRRYKYVNNEWIAIGITSTSTTFSPPYIHEDSPLPGHYWNFNNTSFRKLKLSNQVAQQSVSDSF